MTRSPLGALGWKGPSWAERAGISTGPEGEPVAEQSGAPGYTGAHTTTDPPRPGSEATPCSIGWRSAW